MLSHDVHVPVHVEHNVACAELIITQATNAVSVGVCTLLLLIVDSVIGNDMCIGRRVVLMAPVGNMQRRKE